MPRVHPQGGEGVSEQEYRETQQHHTSYLLPHTLYLIPVTSYLIFDLLSLQSDLTQPGSNGYNKGVIENAREALFDYIEEELT